MAQELPQLIFRREASPALMAALMGHLRELVHWRSDGDLPSDVQLRQSPKGPDSWVSLYLGLTSLINVYSRQSKGLARFQLKAHTTHKAVDPLLPWDKWIPLDDIPVSQVLSYLDVAAKKAETRWTAVEGQVHAVLGRKVTTWSVLNREASTSFRDEATRATWLEVWRTAIISGLLFPEAEPWLLELQAKSRGVSPDFLAVDDKGRLLVIEAKPGMAANGIAGSPAQVAVYARALRAWLDQDPETAGVSLESQLAQRVALGLTTERDLVEPIVVVPVVVVGWGMTSALARKRLQVVADALAPGKADGIDPLEVYRVSPTGEIAPWPDGVAAPPYGNFPVVARTFEQRARLKAVEWKLNKGILEDGSYSGQDYAFCLPLERASENLLPRARGAREFFAGNKIRWHRGVMGGPTNHLLSSQVQCVNALFPLTAEGVKQVFGGVLSIGEVQELDGRTVTFEYGGLKDHLEEGRRVRGAWATWADAAFCFSMRDEPHRTGIALVEWKFTESYRPSTKAWKPEQVARYQKLVESGEVIKADVAFDDLRAEPYYQLMRQQLLASEMEKAGDADRVYVVHVSPGGDTAYHAHVQDKPWKEHLMHPSRFEILDSASLLGLDEDYDARYDIRG